MPRRTLTLYGKPDCCLCDEMKAVVARVGQDVDLELNVVSIVGKPELWARFWKDIPVLVLENGKMFRHRVTEEALAGALQGQADT